MYDGPLIDCDVHQEWTSQDDLLPYLPEGWREYVLGPGRAGPISMDASSGYSNPHGFDREDAFPDHPDWPAGSDPQMFRDQLLDKYNIERAILTYGDVMMVSEFRNPYFAAECARAATQWMKEKWLAFDDRFYGSLLASNHLPEVAAQEIRKHADDPRVPQVMLSGNGIGVPIGHPLYHPIYEAAQETGMPVAFHAGAVNPVAAAGGTPSFYIEYHTLGVQPMMTNLISLIAEGVFEKFPDLQVVLVEGGVAWIPAIMWRFDTDYKGLRREVPWVHKLPSEYFPKNIKVTTQPFETAFKKEAMVAFLESLGGEDFLVFATDYPHWDSDDPTYIKDLIPESWHQKVFHDNAAKMYGWDLATVPA